jgi:signal transduction histidine kinase
LKRYLIIAVALVVAVPLTRLGAYLTVESVRDNLEVQQAERLADAIGLIESDFEELRSDLIVRASAAAEDPDSRFLIDMDYAGGEPPEEVEAAISRFQERHDAGGPISVELYGDDMQLRAWSGPSILPRPVEAIRADSVARVESDRVRKALVVWMPVQNDGFVRVAHAVESASPVTSFLAHTDLASRWRRATGLQLDVSFSESESPTDRDHFVQVRLENAIGKALGSATISRLSGEAIVWEVKRRFANTESFWWTLLLIFLAAGSWSAADSRFRRRRRASAALVELVLVRVGLLVAVRYTLVWLDVPARWFSGGPIEAAFDPIYLASEVGGGLARSVGDLAVTGFLLIVGSLAVFDAVTRFKVDPSATSRSPRSLFIASLAVTSLVLLSIVGHAELARQAMLDTTLDFFAWTRLAPEPLVLTVICSLLLSAIATVVLGAAGIVWFGRWAGLANHVRTVQSPNSSQTRAVAVVGSGVLVVILVAALLGVAGHTPWWALALYVVAMLLPTRYFLLYQPPAVRILRIRSILVTLLAAAVLLYPLLYSGMDEQRRIRLVDVAEDFAARGDEAAVVAMESVLRTVAESTKAIEILSQGQPLALDHATLADFARAHPIVNLVPGTEHARITFFDDRGRPIGSVEQDQRRPFIASQDLPDPLGTETLRELDRGTVLVKSLYDARSTEISGHEGRIGVQTPSGDLAGVVELTLERRSIQSPFGSLFGYSDWRRSLSLAEFRNGRRIRSEGEDFERYVMPPEVEERLEEIDEVWQNEDVYGRAFLTYYSRDALNEASVVAVRSRAIIAYDHLYYLLRIAISGLWLVVPAYLLGLFIRRRMGLIPARRRQYGDRVLDAFLIVGTLAVAGMGLLGEQVITRENDGAIRSRLQRRLQRVENFLARSATADEPLYAVQQKMAIDAMSEELSLDLAVYGGPWLVETSTPISDAGPLMGYRLPAQAYDELFIRRFRQAFVESTNQYGEVYTIGYKALSDDQGWPQSVVAVLTFPEQARIREERARTTAYFFGALLLLLLVIMATATTLARALTGPLKRLRDGMQSVAAGRVQRPIPVESKDEVGELVETFNLMQDQLSESRRKLAMHEREVAWSEMARQVAHEIKNPLTPMKLSIQHLRRAYDEFQSSKDDSRARFARAFDRITRTVSEQIDTLAEIANEFSTFARLPKRHLEVLDPNPVIREAVELTGAELRSGIAFRETRTPVFVTVDRDELRRVLINLLRNAVQSVGTDGSVRVEAHAKLPVGETPPERSSTFVCEVIDDGPGIEPEVQERIFQPNFSTKTSGMGLGLAIAKRNIEAMGGEIGFTTEVGKGSTFWIRLPLVDA